MSLTCLTVFQSRFHSSQFKLNVEHSFQRFSYFDLRRSNSKESSNTQRDWKKYENDHRGKACERNSESSRDRKSHMGDGMFRKPVDNQGWVTRL